MIWVGAAIMVVSALAIACMEIRGLKRESPWLAAARRWNSLAAVTAADDAVGRRCRAVKDAYVRDEFGPEELDWRILIALQPPEPLPRQLHGAALREVMARPLVGVSAASAARGLANIGRAHEKFADAEWARVHADDVPSFPTEPDPGLVEHA